MATGWERKFIITAIGGNSITLTPFLGPPASGGGADVTGTLPVADPDISGGLSSVVLNFSGTPDSTFARHVGQLVRVDFDAGT